MDSIPRVEGELTGVESMTMLAYGLLNVERDLLKPFFERVPELFHSHPHSEEQTAGGYEELL